MKIEKYKYYSGIDNNEIKFYYYFKKLNPNFKIRIPHGLYIDHTYKISYRYHGETKGFCLVIKYSL